MSTEILLIIDKLQKLDSTSLQTLWEWKNRVILEEYYISDEVIPLEVEYGNKTQVEVLVLTRNVLGSEIERSQLLRRNISFERGLWHTRTSYELPTCCDSAV